MLLLALPLSQRHSRRGDSKETGPATPAHGGKGASPGPGVPVPLPTAASQAPGKGGPNREVGPGPARPRGLARSWRASESRDALAGPKVRRGLESPRRGPRARART